MVQGTSSRSVARSLVESMRLEVGLEGVGLYWISSNVRQDVLLERDGIIKIPGGTP